MSFYNSTSCLPTSSSTQYPMKIDDVYRFAMFTKFYHSKPYCSNYLLNKRHYYITTYREYKLLLSMKWIRTSTVQYQSHLSSMYREHNNSGYLIITLPNLDFLGLIWSSDKYNCFRTNQYYKISTILPNKLWLLIPILISIISKTNKESFFLPYRCFFDDSPRIFTVEGIIKFNFVITFLSRANYVFRLNTI